VLTKEHQQLFEKNPFDDQTFEVGESLLSAISHNKQQTWQKLIETMEHGMK